MQQAAKRRVAVLDELRGVAIILMFICHIAYDIILLSGRPAELYYNGLGRFLAPVSSGMFTMISGICTQYSKNNVKRGAAVFGVAMLLTLFTVLFMPGQIIKFGVLHMLGCCMVITGLLNRPLKRIPPAAGVIICIALFLLTSPISRGYIGAGPLRLTLPARLYQTQWLFPLGIYPADFFSSDYYPLVPWLFWFVAGSFAGRIIAGGRLPEWAYRRHIPPLDWLGRHSLAIYIVHQPVFYAVVWVGLAIFNLGVG